jgi:hypothetical protein
MSVKISEEDEQRLRSLAVGLAQRIRDPEEILAELGFTEDDWKELERSRVFRKLLEQAQAEWNSVTKTSQRVKLKAGVNIEMSLPQFYQDMVDASQPLVARVKALELMARLAGLPEVEATEHAPGAQFKLEIHLGDNRVDVVQVGGEMMGGPMIEGQAIPNKPEKPESFKLDPMLLFE